MEFPRLEKCIDDFNAAVADGTVTYKLAQFKKELDAAKGEAIIDARTAGWSAREVTEYFGISKQRLEQIENPTALMARQAVYAAIKSGKLTRRPCRLCGEPQTEAHHEDYSKPLEVDWLCKPHHRQADSARRARLR
jgi:hypothetical protein